MKLPAVGLSAHGMNSRKQGQGGIDLVVEGSKVRPIDLDDLDYGYVLFGRIWFFKRPRINKMASAIKSWLDEEYRPIIVAHSNGLNFTLQALKKLEREGVDISEVVVVSLSGCANRRVKVPGIKALHNWYTTRDGWLLAAKWLPSWTMGSFGRGVYRGKSTNVYNTDFSDKISDHSQWHDPKVLPDTINNFNQLLERYV